MNPISTRSSTHVTITLTNDEADTLRVAVLSARSVLPQLRAEDHESARDPWIDDQLDVLYRALFTAHRAEAEAAAGRS